MVLILRKRRTYYHSAGEVADELKILAKRKKWNGLDLHLLRVPFLRRYAAEASLAATATAFS
jgi:hypothetical protein